MTTLSERVREAQCKWESYIEKMRAGSIGFVHPSTKAAVQDNIEMAERFIADLAALAVPEPASSQDTRTFTLEHARIISDKIKLFRKENGSWYGLEEMLEVEINGLSSAVTPEVSASQPAHGVVRMDAPQILIVETQPAPGPATPAALTEWMIRNSFATGHGETVEDLLKELDWQVKELRERATGPAPEPAASGDAQELLELADWCVKAADGRCCSQCDTNWLHRAKTLRKVAAQAGATGGASLRSELIAELNSMVDSPTLPCPEFHISTPLGAALCKLLLATEARVLKAGASRNEVLEDK